ncbi:hypothetical protein HDU79_007655 [Rhizoclosmatium sp. JEL0117]|nr:hypothetical protein HDU79_007655 [Rhizoclosmatium sp. JEL0117]
MNYKMYIATFATYFVMRKKVKAWWQKLISSPFFIFLTLILLITIIHTFVLRPQYRIVKPVPVSVPAEIVGVVPPPPVAAVPLAAGVPAVPGPIAAADGNSKVKPQNWKDRYEKIKGGIDKYIPKGKDKSKPKEKVGKDVNEKEPFEDFKEGRDSVAKEETNKEVQRDQTERNTAESKFSTE